MPDPAPFTDALPWPAPAKLNLFLHVVGRRPDGYHDLQTVFQLLDYGDGLFFQPRDDGALQRSGDLPGVAAADDLVLRAARALQQHTGCRLGADIHLDKRLPLGGGLGGGSSNAATTLVALNRLWDLHLDEDALADIALALGADVPVFVRGRAAWAEGLGERLTPVELPESWYLVLTPACRIETRAMFALPELPRDTPRITPEAFLQGRTGNVFEPLVCARYPEVAAALAWLRRETSPVPRLPAPGLSGTGSSVFAAFTSRANAVRARDRVPSHWQAFVARGCNESPLHRVAVQATIRSDG